MEHDPRKLIKPLKDPEEKKRAIQEALNSLNEEWGDGLIMSAEDKADTRVQALPSGILSLDIITGIGGYPKGRMVEVFGKESSGKTTVALQAVAECQKNGGFVAYIDVENSLDITYAENLGVDPDSLIFSQPDSGEKAFEALETFAETGSFDLIVVDSVAALTPQAEIDGVNLQGELAKLMSARLKRLASIVNRSKTVVIFINQMRTNVDTMFGEKMKTTGGLALGFYASLRIEVILKGKIEQDMQTVGKKTRLRAVKNKVAPPYQERTIANIWGEGFSQPMDYVVNGVKCGLVTQAGQWYSFDNRKIGNGIFEVKDFLKAHQDILKNLETSVRYKLNFE